MYAHAQTSLDRLTVSRICAQLRVDEHAYIRARMCVCTHAYNYTLLNTMHVDVPRCVSTHTHVYVLECVYAHAHTSLDRLTVSRICAQLRVDKVVAYMHLTC